MRRVGKSTGNVKSEPPLESPARSPYTGRKEQPLRVERLQSWPPKPNNAKSTTPAQSRGWASAIRSGRSHRGWPLLVLSRIYPTAGSKLVVEGSSAEIQLLLKQIRTEMGRYLSTVDEQIRPATGRFKSFDVRF